jgi:hypothetical protein
MMTDLRINKREVFDRACKALFFLSSVVMLWLNGCTSQITTTSAPSPLPTNFIPTAIALTIEARGIQLASKTIKPSKTIAAPTVTQSLTPSATLTPEPEPPTITPTLPTPTYTATSTRLPNIPYSIIQILSPGQASRVVSPFLLHGYFLPGPKGLARVELLGEDGRMLMREVWLYDTPSDAYINQNFEIQYEIPGVAETGRLQISIEDQYGRIMALSSVDLILLSLGESDINPPADQLENIIIQQPISNALIQGSTVRVSGLARTRSDQPLTIQLLKNDGTSVGSRQVAITPVSNDGYSSFSIDVPYKVNTPTRVRLVIWEPGEHIPGIAQLSSIEILLSP